MMRRARGEPAVIINRSPAKGKTRPTQGHRRYARGLKAVIAKSREATTQSRLAGTGRREIASLRSQ